MVSRHYGLRVVRSFVCISNGSLLEERLRDRKTTSSSWTTHDATHVLPHDATPLSLRGPLSGVASWVVQEEVVHAAIASMGSLPSGGTVHGLLSVARGSCPLCGQFRQRSSDRLSPIYLLNTRFSCESASLRVRRASEIVV